MNQNNVTKLLNDLKSTNSTIRNKAAMRVADIGDERAKEYLIDAINVPQNKNNRGTLIHALSNFDCFDLFPFLFDLSITGNYEVSFEASNILFEQDFIISDEELKNAKAKLLEYQKRDNLPEHSETLITELTELLNDFVKS